MAVDHYALCPCGSGKKIKFCKCASSIDAVEKVMKMVEGGQMVAALDRLKHVLQEHPDAAWALAIKGRLLISLGEYDSVAENADRFMRLQPSNPLALAQKAAAEIFRDHTREGAQFLLQALGESGQSVDSFLLEISAVLALSLMSGQNYLSARLYATLPLSNAGYEDVELPQRILYELNHAPSVNMLLKTMPVPIPRPAETSWAERYDEANALLRSNQVLLAESKFEGLNRQYAGEPAILSGLLTCAIWRADMEAQGRLLKQLGNALAEADPEQAARLLAMGNLIDVENAELATSEAVLEVELENAEEATLALSANSQFRPIPAEAVRPTDPNQDSVPPRAAFAMLDKAAPDKEVPLSADNLPRLFSVVLVFGKQTTRPARLELPGVVARDRQPVESLLQDVLGGSVAIREVKQRKLPPQFHASPRIDPQVLQERGTAPGEIESIVGDLVVRNFRTLQLPAFGDRPLESVVDDPQTLTARTALVRMYQGHASYLPHFEPEMRPLSEAAGIEPLPKLTPRTDEELESLGAFDLAFVDPSQLNPDGLEYLLQRGFQVNSPIRIRTAECIVAKDSSEFEEKDVILSAYLTLIGGADDPRQGQQHCEAAKSWCRANNVSNGNVLLSECQMHLRFGDAAGFERCVQEVMRDHSQDVELMSRLQQMLVQIGLINPDGSPRQGPPAAAQAPAGPELFTGEGPAAAPLADASPSPPPADSGRGGSKLWLPGMD